MTQTQLDPVMEAAPQTPTTPPTPPRKKRRNKKLIKNAIIAVVVIAALVVGGYFLYQTVFADKEEKGEILTDFAMRSSISSMVYGSGNVRSKSSATINLAAAGTVVEVYVQEGQRVMQGDPLYIIESAAAQKTLDDALLRLAERQEAVTARQTAVNAAYEELNEVFALQAQAEQDRFISAPFAGQLRDAASLHIGDDVAKGAKIAHLVDDSRFRLSLYFSYAYEGKIAAGQSAQVSVPGSMTTLTGVVEAVNMVRRISPEGSTLFEAVVVVDNPGALTAGAAATASLTGADGAPILPYEGGTLAYYRTADLLTKTTGSVVSVALLSYMDVKQGENLLVLSPESFVERIDAKRDQIKAAEKSLEDAIISYNEAQEAVDKAYQAFDDFSATAPIDGTIIFCPIFPGQDVESGQTAVSISDTAVMTVDINIDERNVMFVKPGMYINLSDWNGNYYMGLVESIAMEGKVENGMSTFPASIKVDNPMGTLMSGMWLNYDFVASQSDNCIVVPARCVRYISTEDGETATVVFLKADARPDSAIEVTPDVARDIPEGFYPVPVTIGLTDIYNVEITEGLNEMDEIFTDYIKEQGNSWG